MKIIPSLLTLSLTITSVSLTACDIVPDKADGHDRSDEWDVDLEEDLEEVEEVEEVDPDEDGKVDPVDEIRAFALRHGDLPSIDFGESGGGDSGGDGGGSEIDPDSLLVIITNGAATCEQPFAADECGLRWSVSFTLPPELQAPGTYALWSDLNGGYSVTGEPYPEGDCWWGGGSLEGMVEIYDIDGASVRGKIFDAEAFDFDANVEFSADGCE